ncbi:FtsH protease activity modulator HflK [Paenibacillus thermoaerophilus]|uniref:Protein HflK n=1 Tax=Paenibacillus thermoaerophilus TaxID=1215385 RepID=A0ABW2V736_9BACL|nr:FtsH protease activity modulator HflK [Paenibacillus thermoaerophilus]TMV17954.1 FtsH protease activity modulator HflK [Paenibacillus thermoaerophilus]
MELHRNESSPRPELPKLPKGIGRKIALGAGGVLAAIAAFTSFYTVQEHETAAIITLGQYTGEESAGLHLKLPYPIQRVVKVPANQTQYIQIGYREKNGEVTPVESEALMITGDENIVSADAVVEWKISDVRKYLYNIDDPEQFLRNAASAAIRSVIGSTSLDYAITDGKTEIQGKVKERLIEMQTRYETGIQVLDVKFQDIEPPEGDVQAAFREVTNAREGKNTKINEAMQYENDILPKARGDAQSMIEQAEGMKRSRVLNAQGDVAKFNAIYEEYAKNKDITQRRLLLETLEKVMPNAKILITDGSGETVNYFPVNELLRQSASGAGGTGGAAAQGGAAK